MGYSRLLAFALSFCSTILALPTAGDAPVHLQRRYEVNAPAKYYYEGAQWTTPVKIGNQILNLMIDTGSSDLWVFSPDVKNPSVNGYNHTLYDYTKSPASKISRTCGPPINPMGLCKNLTFDIYYGFPNSGVQGFVVNDWVSVGGTDPVQMLVEAATNVNDVFKSMPIDGILGLGFQALNTVAPFMTRLLGALRAPSERAPTLPVFTVDFNPKRNGSSPSITIGKVDLNKANGPLSYAPVNYTSGRWQVENVGFEIQGQVHSVKGKMLIDTGGSGLFNVRPEIAKAYHLQVEGATDLSGNNSYYFPCTSKLPPLKMHVGNGTATYLPDQLRIRTSVDGICTTPILGNATAGDFGNFGKFFFENYYTVFDYKAQAVQYALHT
ncbi:MAG: hypothetical protein Q9212_006976 [Teloschistes hypoglaucus]